MKRAWLIGLALSIATPAVAQQYTYVARTAAPVARQGAVTAGILTWQCQSSACSIAGPWPIPSPEACAQLAAEVGRIIEYGRPGRVLDAAGLATCNAGLAATAPSAPAGPSQIYRRSTAPVTGAVVRPSSSEITSTELSFVGGGPVGARAEVNTTITSTELSFVGGAPVEPGRTPTSSTIDVPELSFIGR
jgi:hypothetical protein